MAGACFLCIKTKLPKHHAINKTISCKQGYDVLSNVIKTVVLGNVA